jgi:hypothetical protein
MVLPCVCSVQYPIKAAHSSARNAPLRSPRAPRALAEVGVGAEGGGVGRGLAGGGGGRVGVM